MTFAIPLLFTLALTPDETPAPPAEPPPAPPAPSGPVYPGNSWDVVDPEMAGLDPVALEKLDQYLFVRHGNEVDRKGQRTNAMVIVKDGQIVYERYGRGTTRDTPLLTWSVSKSVMSTLVGAAVGQGKMDVATSASTWIPALAEGDKAKITIDHLLHFSSGLAWNETYEAAPYTSSALAMLYGRGSGDMAAYTASHKLQFEPGAIWRYSSGDANLVSRAVRAATGDDPRWPWKALFDKIGMTTATFEQDGAGTTVGSSYFYASARDLARWGLLLERDGVWNGERVLPEGWLTYTTTLPESWKTMALTQEHHTDEPGASFYLNVGDPSRGLPRPWPDLPPDTFAALGHWGKAVYIIPSWDMVVVRMGDDREYGCIYQGEEGCQPKTDWAFTKPVFYELLAAAAKQPGDGQPWTPGPLPTDPPQEGKASRKDTMTFAPMPAGYDAKESCSCLWVEGRSKDYCEAWVAQTSVPLKSRVIDDANKTVTSTSLGQTRSARWVSREAGCVLVAQP